MSLMCGDKDCSACLFQAKTKANVSKVNISREERDRLRAKRQLARERRIIRTNFRTYSYRLAGGTFWNPGTILQMLQNRKLNLVHTNKSPKTGERYVGIEIEFLSPYPTDVIIAAIIRANLQHHVTLHEDGSVNAPEEEELYGHEVCVLATEKEYKNVLRQVCEMLGQLNACINDTCGLHVHLDMRNRKKETAFHNLVTAQSLFYKMLPASRKKNTFCKPVAGKHWRPMRNRYRSINTLAYRKHRTIEVRMHSGTISYDKIANWVDILLKTVNASKIEGSLLTINSFAMRVRLPRHLRMYMKQRTALFKVIRQRPVVDNTQLAA